MYKLTEEPDVVDSSSLYVVDGIADCVVVSKLFCVVLFLKFSGVVVVSTVTVVVSSALKL